MMRFLSILLAKIKLMVLWIVRILFAPNHFKLPLHTRLYYCIFGGYMIERYCKTP